MSKYALTFSLSTESTDELILGTLTLSKDDLEVNAYIATSGLPGYQGDGDWVRRGRGLIVPDKPYQVITTPIDLRGTKGVEGNFFPITPHFVDSGVGVRGDFGIHFDANVPGSSGCIVLKTQRGWLAYQRDIKAIADEGIDEIPLTIIYT